MVSLACSIDYTICPAVALRGAHQKVLFHAVLAHTGNDATNFQGITDSQNMIFHSKVVKVSRRSPSNGVRKISASFPTTLALLVGSNLLTSARHASGKSPFLPLLPLPLAPIRKHQPRHLQRSCSERREEGSIPSTTCLLSPWS